MTKQIFWIAAVAVTVCALSFNAIAQPGGGAGQRGQGPGMGQGGGMGGGMGQGGGMGGGFGMGMGQGMGPGGMGGFAQLLQNPELANMLEITPDQRGRVEAALRAGIADMMRNPPQMGGDPAVMRERFEQAFDTVQERVFAELSPTQQARARDVSFQITGGLNSPFLNVRSLDALGLNDAQKEQVRRITAARAEEMQAAMRELIEEGVNIRTPEGIERMRAINESISGKYSEQITALLTPAQRTRLNELTAEIPALRERLGIPEPGQPRQPQGQGQGPARIPFVPGEGSWQPGRGAPPTPGGGAPQPRNFPRDRAN